jgi:hypothetical protein
MPAIRLIAGMTAIVVANYVVPSWSADAPIPPPPTTAASEPAAPPSPPASAEKPAVAPPATTPAQPDTTATQQPASPPAKEEPQTAAKPDPAAKPDAAPPTASVVSKPPSVTVIDAVDAHGILGRDVRSPAKENMGRISDVIVDRAGQVRAAVIDFGGFLGVGSRKIVVEWNALHFWNVADKAASITLDLTREQVRAAPEYKDDAPIVVLGASGVLSPLRFQPLTMQER